MSDVVVVLGMHRSGTSAVSGTLTKLGGSPPKNLMAADANNPRGYFESDILTEFHEGLLTSAGSNWSDWRLFNPGWHRSAAAAEFRRRAKELFAEEFDGSPLPVLKDPRICRFAPFWLDVLREIQATPRIVMPIRSPLDVACSLSDRDGFSLTHGLLLWLRHVLDAEAHSRHEVRSIFTWRDFRTDWRGVCGKIAADTHLSWPRLSDRAARDIERFLTKELVHYDTGDAALTTHGEVHEWTLRAYDALLELARNPLSNSALATLDDIRALLDQSSIIFGRLLIEYEVGLEEVRNQAQAATSELNALRARPERLATLAELAARAEVAEKARDEAARDKEALAQSLAAAVAECEALHQSRADISAELQARQRELDEFAVLTEEIEAMLGQAAREKEELSQTLAAAVAERDARVEAAEKARDEAAREKEALAQSIAAAVAEREALHQSRADIAVELQARQRELDEFAVLTEEIKATLAQAAREKEGLSQTLAAAVAERDALGATNARIAADLQLRQQELAEKAAAVAEETSRARRAEAARDEAILEKDALSRSLIASFAERDVLDSANSRIVAELQARRRDLDERATALAELAARAEQAETARDGAVAAKEAGRLELAAERDRALQEKQGLAVRVDQISADLEGARGLAAAREATLAKALAEAESAHAAQRRALRLQLVDAEAALARARAMNARKDVVARLVPAGAKRHWLAKRLLRSGLFDAIFYRGQYAAALPDRALKRALAAAEHYLEEGFHRGYLPNPLFDTRWYLERFEDVRYSGVNPLLHYLLDGWREGRDPGPAFETEYYLETNPDVRAAGANPLAHYLRHGRHEGRLAVRPA